MLAACPLARAATRHTNTVAQHVELPGKEASQQPGMHRGKLNDPQNHRIIQV